MNKELHIISLDVPLPANYGGAVDLFYKIKSLHALGVKIQLHCFSGGRPPQDELDEYCASVTYYPRRKFIKGISFILPYIVSSRISRQLTKDLLKDDAPILMEGVHSTYTLYKGLLPHRKILVRLHNVEQNYYRKLAEHERNWIKKLYFISESLLLRRYERKIAQKGDFLALNLDDAKLYEMMGAGRVRFLPAFHAWQKVVTPALQGNFCLYHGNLSVNENENAARWLLTEVFNDLNIPLVIAGHLPSEEIELLAEKNQYASVISNPAEHEMQELVQKAQVNVLPSFNNTGVKLKLLNALFNGKFCLVNHAAVAGTNLQGLCTEAETASAFKAAIRQLFYKRYDGSEAALRVERLSGYNNEINARNLISWLY